MLYLIGLGLGDPSDISVKGLSIVKNAARVYLEHYTSILSCGHKELEDFYGRPVGIIDREMMEEGCQDILDAAKKEPTGVAVLVVGDPLNATTHTDFILRAVSQGIDYQVIHNASIINTVACCGLQIYNFGATVTIPFWTDNWKPDSFYDKMIDNINMGLHTLCLLDIKVKEPDLTLLARGIKKCEPPRFMSVSQAAKQLLEIIDFRTNQGATQCVKLSPDSICIGLARIGHETQKIRKLTIKEATLSDMGPPLHSLVIPGNLHELEIEMLNLFTR